MVQGQKVILRYNHLVRAKVVFLYKRHNPDTHQLLINLFKGFNVGIIRGQEVFIGK